MFRIHQRCTLKITRYKPYSFALIAGGMIKLYSFITLDDRLLFIWNISKFLTSIGKSFW